MDSTHSVAMADPQEISYLVYKEMDLPINNTSTFGNYLHA
jgi:hypothetical protein